MARALFALLFGVLAVRAAQLTLVRGGEYRERADDQHFEDVLLQPRRGPIVDRHGDLLVLTRESAAVYLRPAKLGASRDALALVARLLGVPPQLVWDRAAADSPFVWIERQVSLDRWAAVQQLGLGGIGSEPARQRVYPFGAVAGHVLGFTGIDGQGLEGIERLLDEVLRGEAEALRLGRDARGRHLVLGEDGWRPLPRVGARVELTIDASLQHVAETELEKAVDEFGAKAGSAVVLAPETGEVLAMANVPRFDPGHFQAASADVWRNRAITDFYEPGSTFKAILAAAALEGGVVAPEERIACENGRYRIGRRVIRDHHPHAVLSFADAIARSSNICCAKVAERLGSEAFGDTIEAFGFGQPTGIDLPGEVAGLVHPADRWGPIHLATIAYGQGIAVTPLQLARAFAAIANGGLLMRPYVVRRIVDEDGHVRHAGRPYIERRAISRQTAIELTNMLVGAVESGTGEQARLEGFSVAGKTGTAQKVDPETGGYHARDRMSSFVGYVPAADPALVILVVVDSPRLSTYGGVVAAPVFRRIAEHGLARLGVLPQQLDAEVSPARARREADAAAQPEAAAVVEGTPNFVGLSMREALVRAQAGGWKVRVEGAGYVVEQAPPPGAVSEERQLTLRFGSAVS